VFALGKGLKGFDVDKGKNRVVEWTGRPDHMGSRIVVKPGELDLAATGTLHATRDPTGIGVDSEEKYPTPVGLFKTPYFVPVPE